MTADNGMETEQIAASLWRVYGNMGGERLEGRDRNWDGLALDEMSAWAFAVNKLIPIVEESGQLSYTTLSEQLFSCHGAVRGLQEDLNLKPMRERLVWNVLARHLCLLLLGDDVDLGKAEESWLDWAKTQWAGEFSDQPVQESLFKELAR